MVGRQAARGLAIMKSLQAFKPLFDVIQRPLLPLLLLKPAADDKVWLNQIFLLLCLLSITLLLLLRSWKFNVCLSK